MKKNFILILSLALFTRLIFIPFFFHGDLNNHAIWGIYSQEFGLRGFYDWLNFGNYAWPGYPPLTLILFYLCRLIWQGVFNILWQININLPQFPSQFIPWFEGNGYLMLLKFPAVLADLGIGILIYRYFIRLKIKNALYYSALFLFNPAIIYISSLWGQIESVVFFFSLWGILHLTQKRNVHAILYYYISMLFKVTSIVGLPIIFVSLVKNSKGFLKDVILTVFLTTILTLAISYIFIDKNYLIWFFNTYVYKLAPGPETLPFITVNAFNLWGLIFGMEKINDNLTYFGLSLKTLAYLISSGVFIIILYKFYKKGLIFLSLSLMFFAAFLFLPRMHERYLYPLFVFLPFVIAKHKKIKKYYYILTIIFLLNLYDMWWVPKFTVLEEILKLDFVTRILSLLNISIFIIMLKYYLRLNNRKWNYQ